MSDPTHEHTDDSADEAIDAAPRDDAPESDEELPSTDELEEPSTEKDPDEAPTSPEGEGDGDGDGDGDEPSHHAVGIGVVEGGTPAP